MLPFCMLQAFIQFIQEIMEDTETGKRTMQGKKTSGSFTEATFKCVNLLDFTEICGIKETHCLQTLLVWKAHTHTHTHGVGCVICLVSPQYHMA